MLEHWMWLAHREGVNDRRKYDILQHFGSAEEAFCAKEADYAGMNLTPANLEALMDKNLLPYSELLADCDRQGICVMTLFDQEYPKRLANIPDPPLVLYYKGTLPDFDSLPAISVVGTRKATAYGQSTAQRLGLEISSCGGLIVSGLADGIDAAAMNGALLAGCPTVGVLGCGVNVIYPRSNRDLFAAVEKRGCILSEFPPDTAPLPWHFLRRNRIISGLSLGVVVVEAPAKSGALSTAHHALEQGRDVYAVPGNVDIPSFSGSNGLLKDGAAAVSCGWDVIGEYAARFPDTIRRVVPEMPEEAPQKVAQKPRLPKKKSEPKPAPEKKDIDKRPAAPYIDIKSTLHGLSEPEQAIVAALQSGERLVDDVIAETGISSGKVLCALTMLELKRTIVRLPGKRIALREQ